MTDLELLEAFAKRGEMQTIQLLVERHERMVFATCLKELKCEADAGDATQQVFISLIEDAPRIHSNVRSWLYRCAVNTATLIIRRRRNQRRHEVERSRLHSLEWRDPDPLCQNDFEVLDSCLQELDSTEHRLLIQNYIEGATQKEIAASLGVSQQAVAKRLARTIEQLRRGFSAKGLVASVVAAVVLIAQRAASATFRQLCLPSAFGAPAASGGAASAGGAGAVKLGVAATVVFVAGLAYERAWSPSLSDAPQVSTLQHPSAGVVPISRYSAFSSSSRPWAATFTWNSPQQSNPPVAARGQEPRLSANLPAQFATATLSIRDSSMTTSNATSPPQRPAYQTAIPIGLRATASSALSAELRVSKAAKPSSAGGTITDTASDDAAATLLDATAAQDATIGSSADNSALVAVAPSDSQPGTASSSGRSIGWTSGNFGVMTQGSWISRGDSIPGDRFPSYHFRIPTPDVLESGARSTEHSTFEHLRSSAELNVADNPELTLGIAGNRLAQFEGWLPMPVGTWKDTPFASLMPWLSNNGATPREGIPVTSSFQLPGVFDASSPTPSSFFVGKGAQAVPEPGTWSILLLAGGAVVLHRRR